MRNCSICEAIDCDCPEDHGDLCFQEHPEEDEIGGAIVSVAFTTCKKCKEKNGHCIIGQYDQYSRLIACPY